MANRPLEANGVAKTPHRWQYTTERVAKNHVHKMRFMLELRYDDGRMNGYINNGGATHNAGRQNHRHTNNVQLLGETVAKHMHNRHETMEPYNKKPHATHITKTIAQRQCAITGDHATSHGLPK